MTEVPDYARGGGSDALHSFPNQTAGAAPDPTLMKPLFQNLIEAVLRKVVLSVIGVLVPGPAGAQLATWANAIFDQFGNLSNLFGGIDLTSGSLNLSSIWSNVFDFFLHPLNFFQNVLGMFGLSGTALSGSPGSLNATSKWSNIANVFIDPLGKFANLIGGFLPNSQLGAHDASKVTSGTFGISFLPSVQTIADGIHQAVNGGATTGNAPSTVKSNLGSVLDGLFNNITKQSGTGRTNTQVTAAVSDQTDQIAAQAAAIQALTANDQAGTNSGVSALEDFEYVNTTSLDTSLWNFEWLQGTSAGIYLAVVDGHNAGAVCPASPLGTNTTMQVFAQFKGTNFQTLTDYQDVAVVVAQKMTAPSFGGVTPPAIDVYGRMNTARTQWVRARFRADGIIEIAYKNGGSVSSVQASTSGNGNPAVGAVLKIRCGTSGGLRIYQAIFNGVIKASWTDGSSVTAVGSSNRQGGWGQQWSDDNPPGKVTQWTMADNAPVAVTGTTFRTYRAATGSVSKATGDQYLASVFDTVDYITPDLTWNAATSTLTCTKAGTYMMSARLENSGALGVSGKWYTLYDVGGTVRYKGNEKAGITLAAFGAPAFPTDTSVAGDAPIYFVPAGGTIRLGAGDNGGGLSIIGDAGGTKTWFSVVKID